MIRALLSFLLLLAFGGSIAHGGIITGTVYTTEHEDSLAADVPVFLAFRDSTDQICLIDGRTDHSGLFLFEGVSTDSSISYRLRIDYRGEDFLGAPISFGPGETEIVFDVLLAHERRSESTLPAGHPLIGGPPVRSTPVVQRPLDTVLVVLLVTLLFGVLAFLARRPVAAGVAVRLSPSAQVWVRDIAGLDLRYRDGVIGEEEYRKVRDSLIDRLRPMVAEPPGG